MRGPATGVWRKGSRWFRDGVDVFNSSKSQNKLHGTIDIFRLEWGDEKATFLENVLMKVNGKKNFNDNIRSREDFSMLGVLK